MGRFSRLVLPFALLLSVIVHGLVIPAFMASLEAVPHPLMDLEERFEGARMPPLPEHEEQTKLGIDAETPASMTWIGYEQHQEHLAALAEIDQAAFTDDPAGGAPTPTEPVDDPVEPVEPVDPAEPVEPVEEPAQDPVEPTPDPAEPVEPVDAEENPPTEPVEPEPTEDDPRPADVTTDVPVEADPNDMPEPVEETLDDAAPDPALVEEDTAAPSAVPEVEISTEATIVPPDPNRPTPEVVAMVPWLDEVIDSLTARSAPPAAPPAREAPEPKPDPNEAAKPPAETTTSPPEPKPEAKPEAPQQPKPVTRPPAPEGTTGTGEPDTGDPADKESDATSVVEVPPNKWKTGKPLAAHGLEIQTRKPAFTLLTQMTTAPQNPIFELRFDRTGKPKKVIQLQTSGHPDVDAAVRASLYRWRAKGAKLKKLKGKEMIPIRMEIVLRAR